MKCPDYFAIEEYKLKEQKERTFKLSKYACFLTTIQCIILSLLVCSFNLNTILLQSLSSKMHAIRTIAIAISISLATFQKLLIRNNSLKFFESWVLSVISIFIFTHFFVFTGNFIKIKLAKSVYLFGKVHVQSSLLFSMLNALSFSCYLNLLSFYINNLCIYTQHVGLIAFISHNFSNIISESKKVLKYTAKVLTVVIITHFMCFHTIIKGLSVFTRISIYSDSIAGHIKFITAVVISNSIYMSVWMILDLLILYNISYNYKEISEETIEYKYHRSIMEYKCTGQSLKNNIPAIRNIEDYILLQTKNIQLLLQSLEESKTKLDSLLFIKVPQVNKNFAKSYKALGYFDTIACKFQYCIQKFVRVKRFEILLENLINAMSVDNFLFAIDKNTKFLLEIIKEAQALDIQTDKYALVNALNK